MKERARAYGEALIYACAGIIVLIIVASPLLSLKILHEIRSTQQTGSPILQAVSAQNESILRSFHASNRTRALILDCVTPTGDCAQRGDKKTGEAVQAITQLFMHGLACTDQPGTQSDQQIYRCVKALLVENLTP